MRELAVHYCPRCGFYAYYQLARNAVCPKCNVKMKPLAMRYQDFMNLGCEERDELLTGLILADKPLTARLLKPHREHNLRAVVAGLLARIDELEEEVIRLTADNKKQKDTVEWMHKMIWDLVKKQKIDGQTEHTERAEKDRQMKNISSCASSAGGEVPAGRESPTDREAPADREIPKNGEILKDGKAPADKEVPAAEDAGSGLKTESGRK